jgi:hypothetical protein
MKSFLASGVLAGLLMFSIPRSVLAQNATLISTFCHLLQDNCLSLDNLAVISSTSISRNSAGVWTATCTGTTSIKPLKPTKCEGEMLNTGTEASPVNACAMQLSGDGTFVGPVSTDDWTETISPSGAVKMTCKLNPKETGK